MEPGIGVFFLLFVKKRSDDKAEGTESARQVALHVRKNNTFPSILNNTLE